MLVSSAGCRHNIQTTQHTHTQGLIKKTAQLPEITATENGEISHFTIKLVVIPGSYCSTNSFISHMTSSTWAGSSKTHSLGLGLHADAA